MFRSCLFRSVIDDNVLLDADVLLNFLFDDQVMIKLVQEHLTVASIATIEGLLSQCDSVDRSAHFL